MNRKILMYFCVLSFPVFSWSQPERFVDRSILSLQDLKEEEQVMDDDSHRWQCFDSKYIQYTCSFVRPLDKQGSSFSIEIDQKCGSHFYSHSHAISGEICSEVLKDLKTILKGRPQFCILGTLDEMKIRNGKKENSWSFYRLKTNSGYVHYRLPYEG